MATQKQVDYALILLGSRGYDVRWMDRTFAALGATMRERSGSVENWLRRKNVAEMARLIDQLKAIPAKEVG